MTAFKNKEGEADKKRGSHTGENNLLPTQLISTGGVCGLKRCWTQSENAQLRSAGLTKDAVNFVWNRYSERRGHRFIPRPQFAFKDLMIH